MVNATPFMLTWADTEEIHGPEIDSPVTRQAIARLVGKGRFTTLLIGGRTLLRRSEVEAFKPKPPGPLPKKNASKRRKAR
jgi:hypothetical protein